MIPSLESRHKLGQLLLSQRKDSDREAATEQGTPIYQVWGLRGRGGGQESRRGGGVPARDLTLQKEAFQIRREQQPACSWLTGTPEKGLGTKKKKARLNQKCLKSKHSSKVCL